uniref:Uncharacterized protein n=1 Tax=Neobodo designis TaxID=312471 RepID=A0A7S1R449_NEODS
MAALRLTAAVSRAATERLILVKEIIRLMALQKDGAAPLDDAPRKLVAAQLQSWQRGIEQGSLSDATTAMLASLDSGALRVIAARASGEEDTSAAELADALSRPAMRRYPDAPRVRVRVASTGVGVSEADLLAALPVRDDGSSGETFASAREALKSRERARLGERSFFLCRRCGEDARGEYRFDASTKRFLRPPNGAPSSQSVTFVSDPQTARKPAAVPTLPAPPQPPLSARDSREHSAPLSTQQQQQLTPALPEFDPPRQHAASSRSPRGGRSPVAGERHAASAFLPAITPRARKPAAFESQFFGPAARPQDESKRLAATVDWAAPTSLMHSTKAGETAVSGPARTTPRHTAAPPGPSATGAA